MEERWLTIPEAAAWYQTTENAIRNRIKQRKYAGTELRGGRRMVRVTIHPTSVKDVTTGQPGPVAGLERLIAAQERTNELLERLLDAQQPPAREPERRKWRWPW